MMPSSPIAPSFLTASAGNSLASSQRATFGAISCAAKLRISRRRCSWSSVRIKGYMLSSDSCAPAMRSLLQIALRHKTQNEIRRSDSSSQNDEPKFSGLQNSGVKLWHLGIQCACLQGCHQDFPGAGGIDD